MGDLTCPIYLPGIPYRFISFLLYPAVFWLQTGKEFFCRAISTDDWDIFSISRVDACFFLIVAWYGSGPRLRRKIRTMTMNRKNTQLRCWPMQRIFISGGETPQEIPLLKTPGTILPWKHIFILMWNSRWGVETYTRSADRAIAAGSSSSWSLGFHWLRH